MPEIHLFQNFLINISNPTKLKTFNNTFINENLWVLLKRQIETSCFVY